MIFDTHAHYDDEAFDEDRKKILGSLNESGIVHVVNCGADIASSRRSVELAHNYSFVYAAVGVHPDNAGEVTGDRKNPVVDEDTGEDSGDMETCIIDADEAEGKCPKASMKSETAADLEENGDAKNCGADDAIGELRRLAADPKVIAIGEIGLDYHWDVYPREAQKKAFIRQWELAIELGLPIEIHSRDAAEDTMNIVREMYAREKAAGRQLRADLHCYSYSPEQAAEYAKMGLYFGIGGVLTFKNARKLREVVEIVPIEQLLLETDCPYLAPEPHRGSRNYSGYLPNVVAEFARIKGLTAAEVEEITYGNACRFFGIEKA